MHQREHTLDHDALAAGAGEHWLFRDRAHAGAVLAANLEHLRGRNALVLAIARGGVPVARQVARGVAGELDLFVARKLCLPGHEELAMGAIASDGTCYVDRELVLQLGISDASLAYATRVQSVEAQRREILFRPARTPKAVAGRTVVLVDDGLERGATMRLAIRWISERQPACLVVATPVGAASTCDELACLVDQLVCPYQPEPFHAVAQHYRDFDKTSDDEVMRILAEQPERQPS